MSTLVDRFGGGGGGARALRAVLHAMLGKSARAIPAAQEAMAGAPALGVFAAAFFGHRINEASHHLFPRPVLCPSFPLPPPAPRRRAASRELPPMDVDWYYTRAASLARKIYLNPGIGVGALARWYGDKTSSGAKPEHFRKASRGLIRHILQNLEKADLVGAVDTATGGRRLSSEGQKEMDTIARLQMEE